MEIPWLLVNTYGTIIVDEATHKPVAILDGRDDRFHLHQNLLEVIKNTVNSIVPVDIKIPCDVDNFAEYNEKSVQLYHAIHKYNDAGYSKRAIAKRGHCGRTHICWNIQHKLIKKQKTLLNYLK